MTFDPSTRKNFHIHEVEEILKMDFDEVYQNDVSLPRIQVDWNRVSEGEGKEGEEG